MGPLPPPQAHDINALFGFRLECLERLGEEFVFVWRRINELFNYLPLAASIEGKILCMHGGIGRSINKVGGPGRLGAWVGWGLVHRGMGGNKLGTQGLGRPWHARSPVLVRACEEGL